MNSMHGNKKLEGVWSLCFLGCRYTGERESRSSWVASRLPITLNPPASTEWNSGAENQTLNSLNTKDTQTHSLIFTQNLWIWLITNMSVFSLVAKVNGKNWAITTHLFKHHFCHLDSLWRKKYLKGIVFGYKNDLTVLPILC